MIYTLVKVHEVTNEVQEGGIDQSEISLAKKASRAFAVGYVNQIYNTIKSLDPNAIDKLAFTQNYPPILYLFISQEESGKIKQLDIFAEKKINSDGLSEVKEIYHESEHDINIIRKKKRDLAQKCIHWKWNTLEIPRMYMMAISEGKKVGTSIYNRYLLSFGWLYPKSFVHQPAINFSGQKIEGLNVSKL